MRKIFVETLIILLTIGSLSVLVLGNRVIPEVLYLYSRLAHGRYIKWGAITGRLESGWWMYSVNQKNIFLLRVPESRGGSLLDMTIRKIKFSYREFDKKFPGACQDGVCKIRSKKDNAGKFDIIYYQKCSNLSSDYSFVGYDYHDSEIHYFDEAATSIMKSSGCSLRSPRRAE